MALYEIGISFTTGNSYEASRLHQEILEVLSKYPRLCSDLPELEEYGDDEYHNDGDDGDDEYDDSDGY